MSLTYRAKILLKRGYGDPSTSLDLGELALDISENRLYIGTGVGNNSVPVVTNVDISTLVYDVSILNYNVLQGGFVTEASLGNEFVWQAGLLYVDISTAASQLYVDGSLVARDISILWLQDNKLEASDLDPYTTNASIAAAGFLTNASLGLFATNVSVNAALFTTNASIAWLNDNKTNNASLNLYVPYTGATTDLSLGTHSISLESLQFDTNPSIAFSEGKVSWDVEYQTLKLNLATDVNFQIGQENFIYAKNDTGATIINGKAVYISSISGVYPTIDLAKADNINTAKAIGLTTMDIDPGELGYVTNLGVVHGLNTIDFSTGDRLYLSGETAGELTTTPALIWSFVGSVLVVDATVGSLLINPQALSSLTGLTDVIIASPVANQVLTWNGTHWINANTATVSAGAGVAYFLTDVSSDVSTYNQMSRTPVITGETIETKTLNASLGEVLIDVYASPSTGLLVTNLDGGVWAFNTYSSLSDIAPNTTITTYVYTRDYLGVETSLFSATTPPLISLTPVLTIQTSAQTDFVVDPSDRLIFKYYATTDSVVDISINFYHGGTTNYSYVNTPLSTRHNDLAGLQGGLVEERYHLTLPEKNVVLNTSGINTGDQDLTPYALKANVNSSLGLYVPYVGATSDVSLGDHKISLQSIQFDTNPSTAFSEGLLSWDSTYETLKLNLGLEDSLQIGQENYIYVRNTSGVTIPNGKAVYSSGISGVYPTVALALADNINTSKVIGLSTMDILPGENGYITNLGIVHDLSTNEWTTGDRLYLSDINPGEFSATPGLVWSFVGTVLEVSATAGSILINPQALTSLTGLTDVLISNPTNNQVLTWNGLQWINANTATTSAGAGVAYFLSDISSNIPTYEEMAKFPATGIEVITTRTVNASSGQILINSYVSPSTGLLVSNLDGGVWAFNTYSSVSAIVDDTLISTYVYKRDVYGVETSLFSVTTPPLISLTPLPAIKTSVQPDFVVDPSDRLVFKYFVSTNSVTDVSLSFYLGGNDYYTYVNTPLATRHNDLAGLQGGLAFERYHINEAQAIVVGNTSGINTGDQDLSPYATIVNVETSLGLFATNASVNSAFSQIYGSQYKIDSSLGLSTTNSTVPIVKVLMTTTSLPAGDYKITSTWTWSCNNTVNYSYFDTLIDDVSQGTVNPLVYRVNNALEWRSDNRLFYKTLSAGVHTIKLRYWTSSGAVTTSMSDATIELIRVK